MDFLHPECPDRVADLPEPRTREELLRYGPTEAEAALRFQAEVVTAELAAQKEKWRGGFTRRRIVAGAGAVGVAALGSQLLTAKVAFGAPGDGNTLIVIMLRGGMDFLSVVVPRNDANYASARPTIAVPGTALLDAGPETRFGLHPAMAPLHELWKAGNMAAVAAVASPDASRSHFQAQDCYERGAASTAVRTGWLDRVLSRSIIDNGASLASVGTHRSAPGTAEAWTPAFAFAGIAILIRALDP